MLGSQFLAHPPIEPYEVRVTRPGHPLVAGIEPFTVTDELYVCELHGELEVLLHAEYTGPCRGFAEGDTAALDDAPRPVLYLRRYGLGEVCYFTLGHCRGRHDMQDLGVADTGRVDRGPWETPEFVTVLRAVCGVGGGCAGTGVIRPRRPYPSLPIWARSSGAPSRRAGRGPCSRSSPRPFTGARGTARTGSGGGAPRTGRVGAAGAKNHRACPPAQPCGSTTARPLMSPACRRS